MSTEAPKIDWSAFTWPIDQTITCRCGELFRAHAKFSNQEEGPGVFSQIPCPSCRSYGPHARSEGDPKSFTIGGKP